MPFVIYFSHLSIRNAVHRWWKLNTSLLISLCNNLCHVCNLLYNSIVIYFLKDTRRHIFLTGSKWYENLIDIKIRLISELNWYENQIDMKIKWIKNLRFYLLFFTHFAGKKNNDTFPLLICTWFLKNQVWKIKFDELYF